MSDAFLNTTEAIKNIAETVAVLAGGTAVIGWLYTRKDRAASVLLELEERFNQPDILEARGLLEDRALYRGLDSAMRNFMDQAGNPKGWVEHRTADEIKREGKMLEQLDALLRFYVLLIGIRKARQVPDDSLRICYAYWLNLYYDRVNYGCFREYVGKYFPTSRAILDADEELLEGERFFGRGLAGESG